MEQMLTETIPNADDITTPNTANMLGIETETGPNSFVNTLANADDNTNNTTSNLNEVTSHTNANVIPTTCMTDSVYFTANPATNVSDDQTTVNKKCVTTTAGMFLLPAHDRFPIPATSAHIEQEVTGSIYPCEDTTVMYEKENRQDAKHTVYIPKKTGTQPLQPRHENESVESEIHLLTSNDEQENIDNSSPNDPRNCKNKKDQTYSSFTSGDDKTKYKLFIMVAVVFAVIVFIGLITIGHLWVCTNKNKSMNSTDINPKKGFLDVNAKINISKSSMQVIPLHLKWDEIIESNRQIVNLTWNEVNTPVVNIKEDGSKIQVNQNGSYSFLLSLNVDTGNKIIAKETNAKRSLILVCIRNSRGQQEKCQKQKLAPNTSGPLSIQSILILYQGDAVWVSVTGAKYLYINNAMNSFTIIKWNN